MASYSGRTNLRPEKESFGDEEWTINPNHNEEVDEGDTRTTRAQTETVTKKRKDPISHDEIKFSIGKSKRAGTGEFGAKEKSAANSNSDDRNLLKKVSYKGVDGYSASHLGTRKSDLGSELLSRGGTRNVDDEENGYHDQAEPDESPLMEKKDRMDAYYKDFENKPVHLVDINDDGTFAIKDEGMEVLNKISGRLGIFGLCGDYRTGKSTLLNMLIDNDLSKGFQIDHTVKACTKGIWIWGRPVFCYESDMTLLFMDTEGLNSIDASETHHAKIFALAVLLSSYFAFNSLSAINEEAVRKLSLAAQLSKNVEFKVYGNETKEEAIAQFTPKFLWILRDFMLELRDLDNNPITSQQYLENSLSSRGGSKQSSEIRRCIINYFRDRDCITMPTAASQQGLSNLHILPKSKFNQEFLDTVDNLRTDLRTRCPVKRFMGQELQGKTLASLLENYVENINKGGVPNLTTAWEMVVENQNEETMEETQAHFENRIKSQFSELPIDTFELIHIFESVKVDSIAYFKKRAILQDEFTTQNLIEDLERHFDMVNQNLTLKNNAASGVACRKILQEVLSPLRERLSDDRTYSQEGMVKFSEDFQEALKTYKAKAVGPQDMTVLIDFLSDSEGQKMQSLQKRLAAEQETASNANKQLECANEEIEKLKQQIRSQKERHEDEKQRLEDERRKEKKKQQACKCTIF